MKRLLKRLKGREKEIFFIILSLIMVGGSLFMLIGKTSHLFEKKSMEKTSVNLLSLYLQNSPDKILLGKEPKYEFMGSENLSGLVIENYKVKTAAGDINLSITADNKYFVVLQNQSFGKVIYLVNPNDFINSIKGSLPSESRKPKVLLFLMSFCPYGNQMEIALSNSIKDLLPYIDFEPVYIYYPGYMYGNSPDACMNVSGNFYCSMHGINELKEDLVEKAVYKIYGPETWFDFVVKVDASCKIDNVESCWKDIAKELDLNISKIESYVQENKETLILDDFRKSSMYQAWGSPTLIVNNDTYSFPRAPVYLRAYLCKSFESPPEGC